MAVSVHSLSGEQMKIDGIEHASTIADIRALTATALACSSSSIKLLPGCAGVDACDSLLRDDQKLDDLESNYVIAIQQVLDPSLIELTSNETSEYDEGQTDFYKSTSLTYDGGVIWSMSDHKACHIGGWGGRTHNAVLSADKTLLTVTKGSVQRKNGNMYGPDDKFAPKTESLSVEDLLMKCTVKTGKC